MSVGGVVLDSYALIAYLEGEDGKEVEDALKHAEKEGERLLLSVVNWGEVYYSMYRSKGKETAEESLFVIDQLPVTLVEVDRALTHVAAALKSRYSVAYGDCFAAALAIQRGGKVITGDREFKKLEKEVGIIWLKAR
jgi:ribonuclease VapC